MTETEMIRIAEGIGGFYDRDELQRLLSLAINVPTGGVIVEIGVEKGRSASIFVLEGDTRTEPFKLHLIDSWAQGGVEDFQSSMWYLLDYLKNNVIVFEHWHPSAEIADQIPDEIDLLHIDGDHETGIWDDCKLYLPKVKIGGVVVFHDYARKDANGEGDVFPEVTKAVNHFIVSSLDWEPLGVVNTQLAARRLS